MNQNPNALALAIVHQAVQASELQEAQQAVMAGLERQKELQQAIDTLVADRETVKKAHAEHLEQIGGQLKAEQDALLNAQIEHNQTLRDLAGFYGAESVEAMLAAAKPAPAPVVMDMDSIQAD